MGVARVVSGLQARLRRIDLIWSLAAGCVALGATAVAGSMVPWRVPIAIAGLAGLVIASIATIRSRRHWTPLAAAHLAESRLAGMDNLIVTAVELSARPGRPSSPMREEVMRQAFERIGHVAPSAIVSSGPALATLTASALGAVLVAWTVWSSTVPLEPRDGSSRPVVLAGIRAVRVTVTPPAYLDRGAAILENPETVDVPAGSQVRVEVDGDRAAAWLEDPDEGRRGLVRPSTKGPFAIAWTPERSQSLAIATGSTMGVADETRLLSLRVVPDAVPVVRLVSPARDLAFTTANRAVDIAIHASDGEALRDLDLAFVRLSGSGEAFSFQEGRVPLEIDHADGRTWQARARWRLSTLGLEDGDSLVYRAVVRDSNPAGEPVASESFTIDIGRRLEFAGSGFAVPDEDRRYAISQQMVIVKTERLQAARATHDAEAWSEQTRMLAIEQRMVRSEVVFLSGGDVQDEVEEAEHSHELQEGRLENAGRAEMLRAMNEMSRAEARLNDGDTTGALVFERAALAALQRAFDRRRYFLRTIPERARIDQTRRLSGDRSGARSSSREMASRPDDPLAAERDLLRDLMPIARDGSAVAAAVVARVGAIDPASDGWRERARHLAAASTADERRVAASAAMAAIAERARSTLAPAVAPDGRGPGALDGWWADELGRRRPR